MNGKNTSSVKSDKKESKNHANEALPVNTDKQRKNDPPEKPKVNYAELYRLYISFIAASVGVAVLIILIIRILG